MKIYKLPEGPSVVLEHVGAVNPVRCDVFYEDADVLDPHGRERWNFNVSSLYGAVIGRAWFDTEDEAELCRATLLKKIEEIPVVYQFC